MANLIEQIMMQARGGSAQGQGFGSFAVQGMQLRQNQQQINLRERQLALEAELQPLRMREAQLKLDESELKLNETRRMMGVRESNIKAFDELSELITSNVHEGTAGDISVHRAIRQTLIRNPALMEDPRAIQMLKYFNDSMQLSLEDRKVKMQEDAAMQQTIIPDIPGMTPSRMTVGPRGATVTMEPDDKAYAPSTFERDIQSIEKRLGRSLSIEEYKNYADIHMGVVAKSSAAGQFVDRAVLASKLARRKELMSQADKLRGSSNADDVADLQRIRREINQIDMDIENMSQDRTPSETPPQNSSPNLEPLAPGKFRYVP